MKRKIQGYYTTVSTVGEETKAFVPNALPPKPAVVWSPDLRVKFSKANHALGQLNSISVMLPDRDLFVYMYVRKEALLSSQIEGTQSSLSDLLQFESELQPGVPEEDVADVCNYISALEYGIKSLDEGFPLCNRLIQELHNILLSSGRGSQMQPGEFRKSQNWIGGTRPGNAVYVPPPPEMVISTMGDLELFINDEIVRTTSLEKAALAHVQFETIHPFLDGNGRLGRLLITLILYAEKVLSEPSLYLSLYFKENRNDYYELLNIVRRSGDWESWLMFFADAVITTANQANKNVQELVNLSNEATDGIKGIGRGSSSALKIYRCFLERPMARPKWLSKQTMLSQATVNKSLTELENLGILQEITGKQRNRVYLYKEYFDIISKGTIPLS